LAGILFFFFEITVCVRRVPGLCLRACVRRGERRQLRAAFPEGKECRNDVFGMDLPAYRPSTGGSMRTCRDLRMRTPLRAYEEGGNFKQCVNFSIFSSDLDRRVRGIIRPVDRPSAIGESRFKTDCAWLSGVFSHPPPCTAMRQRCIIRRTELG
jgi:hypothetical protein